MTSSISLFDLKPGRILEDRFEIVRAFRQGGMSATFEVREGDATYELQVFPAGMFEGPEQATEFADALRNWTRVDSPAVLKVRECIAKADGTILLVTDFPPGSSLREWIKDNRRMSVQDTLQLGLRLLDGLVEAHESDLVHGDIKPYNVMLDGADAKSALLVDGGITTCLWSAKHLGDKTALIGTPVYAPAEQFGGDSPEIPSDIYNLATVLFETVTGVVPWPGESFLQIFQAKLDKTPPSMRRLAPDVEVPEGVERAIVGGLLTDKRERYGSAVEFRDALRAVAD